MLYLAGKGVPKDFKVAVGWLKKAAEKGDASAQNNMAKIFMVKGKLETALKLSKLAVKKKPKQAFYWDTLATILMKFGEKQAAFKAWDQALKLKPNNRGIRKNATKYGYQR
jgi:TPR repeat protein